MTAAALALLSGGAVLWELLLTRLYSVVLYYHYAFAAVSCAMFGLTLGALRVQLSPEERDPAAAMGQEALWTAGSMAACVTVQLALPLGFTQSGPPAWYLAATLILAAAPFVPAGTFIALALTRLPGVGGLYAADLAGAGAACALLPALLRVLGAPGAVLAAAALCAAAAVLVGGGTRRRLGAGAAVILLALAGVNRHTRFLRVRYRHDGPVGSQFFESWNAFSRVSVSPLMLAAPFGWGLDPAHAPAGPYRALLLEIDSGAATVLTPFDGDLRKVSYLASDLTSFAHHLRPGGDVFVMGPGGGRDVLAALALGQRSVRAVEVNPDIVRAVNGVFGDFTGHLDRDPRVRFETGEARGVLARAKERFDVIQASFVDTVAATAAGAYAFTENGLYTKEAWRLFLDRLKPRGVLSVSRFYYGSAPWPVELCRTVALAAAALRERGVRDPASNVLVVRAVKAAGREGAATVLVSPEAFSDADLALADRTCAEMGCEVVLSRTAAKDADLERALKREGDAALAASFPLDVTPPTDDRPFFFLHARLRDALRGQVTAFGGSSFNSPAVRILAELLAAAVFAGLALSLAPLAVLPGRAGFRRPLYFAAIGAAYMLVEVGFIERLGLVLGNPTYGFTVALAGFLVASGLGSLASGRLAGRALGPLLAAAGGALAADALVRSGTATMLTWPAPARVAAALAATAACAFPMGFAFPLGLEAAKREGDGRGAWYWAVNGAASVAASVLAMAVSLGFGISAAVRAGAACYALAAVLAD